MFHVGVSIEGTAMQSSRRTPATTEYSCPGSIRDTELAITARVVPRAEEEGVKSRSGRIGERVGSIPKYAVKRA